MNTYWFNLENKEIVINQNAQYVSLFVGKSGDKLSTALRFIHKNPNINSNILIKAILFDNSKVDITGDLVIEKGAKYVDTYLKIDVLVLSDRASARAVPSLEITENDVKGGHGATIGPVDPEQLFYLQSKGLNREAAEIILAEGFIQDVVTKFERNMPPELEYELAKI